MSGNHQPLLLLIPKCQKPVLQTIVKGSELPQIRHSIQLLEQFTTTETIRDFVGIVVYLLLCIHRERVYKLYRLVHIDDFKLIALYHALLTSLRKGTQSLPNTQQQILLFTADTGGAHT